MIKNKHRVVRDSYNGYEAQVKFWWFPFGWFQMWDNGIVNSFSSIEKAKDFIMTGKKSETVWEET